MIFGPLLGVKQIRPGSCGIECAIDCPPATRVESAWFCCHVIVLKTGCMCIMYTIEIQYLLMMRQLG